MAGVPSVGSRVAVSGCLLILLMASLATGQTPAWLDPSRVLVIFNTSFPDYDGSGVGDSLEAALAYQAKRGVPPPNMLGIACSTNSDTYAGAQAWAAFGTEVRDPVQARLNVLGANAIDTLLFMHGVPFRFVPGTNPPGARSIDQSMRSPLFLASATAPYPTTWYNSNYFEASPGVGNDMGHFSHTITFSGMPFYLVARLDGVDLGSVLDLIEGALYGDLYLSTQPGHYQGRIYVDTRFSAYPNVATLPYPQMHGPSYANADQDMAWGTQWMQASGLPFFWENTASDLEIGQPGATFHTGVSAATATDALFYYGWYNFATYHDVWEWLPGSAASDLNSDSIAGIRSASSGTFLASAFRKGLTAGVGVIGEPFLAGHPYPEVFIKYLLDGYTFAEAASLSDPTHLWRSLYVGDPLYCPFRAGKQPVLDQTPPPVPTVRARNTTGTDAVLETVIDTTNREPDLVVVQGTYGLAPVLDQTIAPVRPFRTRPATPLSGLVAGGFYRAQLTVVDPAGLSTPAPELAFFSDSGSGPAAAVQLSTASPAAWQGFLFELALRVPGGIGGISSLGITVDAGHLGLTGVDLLPLLQYLPVTPHGDFLGGDTVSLEIEVPTGLGSGSYTLHLDAGTPSGPVHASLPFVVP